MKKVICRDIYGKKYSVYINKLSFRPSVYGIIIKNGKILLSKQWDGYDFPGGGIDIGEPTKEALKREIWEETGLTVKVGKFVYFCEEFFYSVTKKKFFQCLMTYYICKNPKGKLTTDNFDENEKKYADLAEWISLSKIGKLKFYNQLGKNSITLIKKAIKLK